MKRLCQHFLSGQFFACPLGDPVLFLSEQQERVMLLAHGGVFLVGLLAFSAFGKQQNVGIYQIIKDFNFNVCGSSIHMLDFRDVGGMVEIIFMKTEFLVRDICRT